MHDKCAGCKICICPDPKPPQPINLSGDPPPDDSGFLIIRLKAGTLTARQGDLATDAKAPGLTALVQKLESYKLSAKPLITSVKSTAIDRLEQAARGTDLPPLRSLTAYWRLDTRNATQPLEEIEAAFRRLPDVEL